MGILIFFRIGGFGLSGDSRSLFVEVVGGCRKARYRWGNDAVVEGFEGREAFFHFADFTLPDAEHFPTFSLKNIVVGNVAGFVVGNLVLPEVDIGLGHLEMFATFMAVPKTTVDEYDSAILF